MAFLIKDTKLKLPTTNIVQQGEHYISFPNNESVLFDEAQLIPIGLLSVSELDDRVDEPVLIALPNVQGIFYGDEPFLTYSLTDKGWSLDQAYAEAAEHKIEENYAKYYQQAHHFFKEHGYLNSSLEESEQETLFKLGGQPPLGQNWDAILYDEMGDNPELDHYHEVMDEGDDAEVEEMSQREITYLDEEQNQEFIYLGRFNFELYLATDMTGIVFYQPELKKVMLVIESS